MANVVVVQLKSVIAAGKGYLATYSQGFGVSGFVFVEDLVLNIF